MTIIQPIRPWAASKADRAMTGASLLSAVLLTALLVAVTPLKGKLAYFFVFFVVWFILDSILVFRRFGTKGVRDGLAAKITLFGAVIVMMAVASILWATISRRFVTLLFSVDLHSQF